jgi:hypothetical protein
MTGCGLRGVRVTGRELRGVGYGVRGDNRCEVAAEKEDRL